MTPPRSGGSPAAEEYFDLDKAVAEASADFKPFKFTFAGTKYELPPQNNWPVAALGKLAAGQLDDALAELIGTAQYFELRDAGLTVGALNSLFDEAAKAAGMDGLPNSPQQRPPGSSRT